MRARAGRFIGGVLYGVSSDTRATPFRLCGVALYAGGWANNERSYGFEVALLASRPPAMYAMYAHDITHWAATVFIALGCSASLTIALRPIDHCAANATNSANGG